MISVKLWADVKPTEDIEKVKQALTNLCPPATIIVEEDLKQGFIVKGSAVGPEAIATFAKKFREQRILEAVRQKFLKLVQNGRLIFGMQRQAAFMNRFHICDLNDYSAMGPIRVEIQATYLQNVIDYISPPTLKGKPQFQKDLKLE
ncbi:MAG: RNA-binding domain-containing protein [Candidatus Thorarchaeota archaeon]